jgi:hypothetical protein
MILKLILLYIVFIVQLKAHLTLQRAVTQTKAPSPFGLENLQLTQWHPNFLDSGFLYFLKNY